MRWLRKNTKRQVAVSLVDGETTLTGLLWEQARDGLLLRSPAVLDPHGETKAMAGELFVPRDSIAFVQFPELRGSAS